MPKKLKPSKGTIKNSPKPKSALKSSKTKKSVITTNAKAVTGKARPLAKAKAGPKAPMAPPPRVPTRQFSGAVAALEVGIKLMYSEDYVKAAKAFNKVIAEYPEEPEI